MNASTTPAASRVLDVVDRVIVLKRPLPDAVGSALQIAFPLTASGVVFDQHEGTFADGPFATALLKFVKAHRSGALILTARPEQPVGQTELDLHRFGPVPPPAINPHIPPEGTLSYSYEFPEDALTLAFAFTYRSKVLSKTVLSWGPAAKASVTR